MQFPDFSQDKEIFFSKIVELAADSILAINEDMELVFFNKEAENTFGYKSEEIIGQHINKLIPAEYHEQHNQHIKKFLKSNVVARLMNNRNNLEVKGLREDGSVFFCEISLIKVGMQTGVYLVAILRDITESKEREKKLQNLAETDTLTGIMNRGTIENVLRKEIERASRYDKNLALLMLDIDHFKKVNDTFGHEMGDFALKHLTLICLDNIREVDFMGRWGGEEFVILMPEVDAKGVFVVAEKLRKSIENQPIEFQIGEKIQITVSIGGALFKKSNPQWEFLFREADTALYKAKEQGRNQFCMAADK